MSPHKPKSGRPLDVRVRDFLSRRYFRLQCRARGPAMWADLQAFCLFCGYGRSGHSAIGSIVDAHPSAIVSHELNALKRWREGTARNDLFADIAWLSRRQAREGRRSTRVDGGSYMHEIGGAQGSTYTTPTVIGDKNGAATTRHIRDHGPQALNEFQTSLGLPLRVMHVMRNPYDIVAAGITLGRTGFFDLVPVVAEVRSQWMGQGWLDVYYEDVVGNPDDEITRICTFLGLPVVDDHLRECAAYLFSSPHRRRHRVEWPRGLRSRVADTIARYDFLSRYSWED